MESYGYYVCIYSNKHWFENFFTDEIFKKYDIWLAQWNEKPTFQRTYGMWQKSSKGNVPGIDGYVDLNESYKNYPAIMKYNGLNGFGAPIEAKPPKRGFAAGQKVVLKNAKLYSSAWSDVVKNHLSGTYYIYDGIYFEGRYRVTNSLSNVERKPIGKYVTGFVHRDDMRNENA
jgi:GH25 family lysozyme M1 (1,4-beta-N-acetylmuramidase)